MFAGVPTALVTSWGLFVKPSLSAKLGGGDKCTYASRITMSSFYAMTHARLNWPKRADVNQTRLSAELCTQEPAFACTIELRDSSGRAAIKVESGEEA